MNTNNIFQAFLSQWVRWLNRLCCNFRAIIQIFLYSTFLYIDLDDLMDITDYLLEFNETQIYHLGLVLGLRYTTMVEIKQSPTFRDDMIAAWLAKKDDVGKKGGPTWRNLANAMRHKRLTQNGLADRIASDKGLL